MQEVCLLAERLLASRERFGTEDVNMNYRLKLGESRTYPYCFASKRAKGSDISTNPAHFKDFEIF
jgi:hypothetical protein